MLIKIKGENKFIDIHFRGKTRPAAGSILMVKMEPCDMYARNFIVRHAVYGVRPGVGCDYEQDSCAYIVVEPCGETPMEHVRSGDVANE